jgi:transcriptional regulator with PAS, ATPase and Fis domain
MASAAELKLQPSFQTADLPPENIYFGPSEVMSSVRQRVNRAAGLNVPILILGESGTGKEVLARYIHSCSPWRSGPFIKVNCPAIPGTLLESELFGYAKGAFTGANNSKPGRMELAHGGSLFLDEIAELDAALQAKLLHVLQDGHFTRIGDHEERQMDARVICATNRNLAHEIETSAFRSDLFYRINVITITLPPLRERREDIPYLVEYLRGRFNIRFKQNAPELSRETVQLLKQREWPGNVRELENAVERAVVLCRRPQIDAEDLTEAIQNQPAAAKPQATNVNGENYDQPMPLAVALETPERKIIEAALKRNNWNRQSTAAELDINRTTLYKKMRKYRLDVGETN